MTTDNRKENELISHDFRLKLREGMTDKEYDEAVMARRQARKTSKKEPRRMTKTLLTLALLVAVPAAAQVPFGDLPDQMTLDPTQQILVYDGTITDPLQRQRRMMLRPRARLGVGESDRDRDGDARHDRGRRHRLQLRGHRTRTSRSVPVPALPSE